MVFINYVVFVDGIIYYYIWYNTTGWLLSKNECSFITDMFRPIMWQSSGWWI